MAGSGNLKLKGGQGQAMVYKCESTLYCLLANG